MRLNNLKNKRIFWSNKWDKIWLLILPACLIITIITTHTYPFTFWYWTVLIFSAGFNIYVLYHMFNPKFIWIDTTTIKGKELQKDIFKIIYNDHGVFEYKNNGFAFTDKNNNIFFVAWHDIESIFAYKKNIDAIGELNIDIFIKNDLRICLTEESPGWYQFVAKIKEVFPIDKEFDIKLMSIPFETNLELIYNATGKTKEQLAKLILEKYHN